MTNTNHPTSQHLVNVGYTIQHYSPGGHTLLIESYYDYPMYFTLHGDNAPRSWSMHKKYQDKLSKSQRPKPQRHYA